MRVLIILSFATLAWASCSHASPGGYTLKGGVFDFKRQLDYMNEASHAGKFAWNKRFEAELDSPESDRSERNAPEYIPTFFTSQHNHKALTDARQNGNVRPQREVIQPLYYETYHKRR
jgi:hypothetical protein